MNQFFEQLKADIVATHAAALQAATQEYETKMEALRILAGEPEAPEVKKEPRTRLNIESIVRGFILQHNANIAFSREDIIAASLPTEVSPGSVGKALQRLHADGTIILITPGKGRKLSTYRKIVA